VRIRDVDETDNLMDIQVMEDMKDMRERMRRERERERERERGAVRVHCGWCNEERLRSDTDTRFCVQIPIPGKLKSSKKTENVTGGDLPDHGRQEFPA
jgi:hypothetical protein